MKKYIEALEGISYYDWIRVKMAVDEAFNIQKGEFDRSLKFANVEDAERIIRSRFGCKSD